jgi:hypothetical protein
LRFAILAALPLVAACASFDGVNGVDVERKAADAAAGRSIRYLVPRQIIFKELINAVQFRGYQIEKNIPQKAYLLSEWRHPVRVGQIRRERVRVEAEVLGEGQPPHRVMIRCRRELQSPESSVWVDAGWSIEEEDELYAALHRALSWHRP